MSKQLILLGYGGLVIDGIEELRGAYSYFTLYLLLLMLRYVYTMEWQTQIGFVLPGLQKLAFNCSKAVIIFCFIAVFTYIQDTIMSSKSKNQLCFKTSILAYEAPVLKKWSFFVSDSHIRHDMVLKTTSFRVMHSYVCMCFLGSCTYLEDECVNRHVLLQQYLLLF